MLAEPYAMMRGHPAAGGFPLGYLIVDENETVLPFSVTLTDKVPLVPLLETLPVTEAGLGGSVPASCP